MPAWMFPAMAAGAGKAFGGIAAGGAAKLGGAAALMGGIGSLMGGASGFFGGGSQDYSSRTHRNMLKNEIRSRFNYSRRYGEKFGFHPLTGLGISPSSTPMGYAQGKSSTGRGLATMGQSLERVSGSGMSELQKAQIENVRAHTRLLNSEANQMSKDAPLNMGDNAPISEVATAPGLYKPEALPKQAPGGGRQLGEQGSDKSFFNPEGYYTRAPAEGLEDLVSEDLMAKVRFYAPEWVRMVKGWSTHGFRSNENTVSGVRYRNATRLYLAALEKSHPPPKGMMYVWSVKAGSPRRVPKKKRHRLFDHTTKFGMQMEFYRRKKRKRPSAKQGDFGYGF